MTTPINPKLPARFDDTPNQNRPASQRKWWGRPYITTHTNVRDTLEEENAWRSSVGIPTVDQATFDKRRAEWLQHWPSGTRYDVRCLDGGAWDRSTWKGSFPTLEEALQCARDVAGAGTYGPWPGAVDDVVTQLDNVLDLESNKFSVTPEELVAFGFTKGKA